MTMDGVSDAGFFGFGLELGREWQRAANEFKWVDIARQG